MDMDTARCPECLEATEAGDAFCGSCGAALATSAVPAQRSGTGIEAEPTRAPTGESQVAPAHPGNAAEPVHGSMGRCLSCGAVLSPDGQFCPECGAAQSLGSEWIGHGSVQHHGDASAERAAALGRDRSQELLAAAATTVVPAVPRDDLQPAEPPAGPALVAGDHVFFLEREVNMAGRAETSRSYVPEVDVSAFAEASTVSRLHALLVHHSEGLLVRDLGTTNGTVLNGERLVAGRDYVVHDGAVLRFGGVGTTYREHHRRPSAIPAAETSRTPRYEPAQRRCPHCSRQNPSVNQFCNYCGRPLGTFV